MRLYHNPASPYVRKVRALLAEAGRAEAVELLPVAGHPTEPGTLPVHSNPLGKIPALERPDGPTLFDSRVICRFLDHEFGAGLYPGPPALWQTLTLEALADGMMDAAVLMVYETRSRAEGARDSAWVEAQWAKIARAMAALEAEWMSHLAGRPDMGQIAVACALGYLDFRHAGRDWRAAHPALADWHADIMRRESLAATVPQG